MIIVAKPSKPFTYTAKSTARRQAIIQDYEDEINLIYDAVDESNQVDIQPSLSWDDASTIYFIRTVVNKVLVRPVLDDEDFFERGCDRCVRAVHVRFDFILIFVAVCRQHGFVILYYELSATLLRLIPGTLRTILCTHIHLSLSLHRSFLRLCSVTVRTNITTRRVSRRLIACALWCRSIAKVSPAIHQLRRVNYHSLALQMSC